MLTFSDLLTTEETRILRKQKSYVTNILQDNALMQWLVAGRQLISIGFFLMPLISCAQSLPRLTLFLKLDLMCRPKGIQIAGPAIGLGQEEGCKQVM
jgi:hypothetical protein